MLKHLADEKQIYPDRYFALSLGQGQMVAAKRLLDMGVTRVIYLNEWKFSQTRIFFLQYIT